MWQDLVHGMDLWNVQVLNETLQGILPPQDLVMLHRPATDLSWYRHMYSNMVQDHTQFVFDEWAQEGYEQVIHDDPSAAERIDNKKFNPKERTFSDVPLSGDNIMCSKQAVILSKNPRIFSGPRSAFLYREKVLESYGLTNDWPAKPQVSNKVLVDFRGHGFSKNLVNAEEIANIARHYSLDVEVTQSYLSSDSLEKHVRAVSDIDVYIVVHGAEAMSAMFMKPGSTVVEIFPYGVHSPMYKYLASNLDVNYVEVVSWLKADEDICAQDLFTEEFYGKCQYESNIAHHLNGYCTIWCNNACVVGPLYDVEVALINAYSKLGVNLNSKVSSMFSLEQAEKNMLNNYHDQHVPEHQRLARRKPQ
uniref:Glycosyltransferase 61 catalytic domain-containing protein n=1 Tax=Vannella robusta TaxID=1487602 RepID=A0A7S4IFP3_9EUKA